MQINHNIFNSMGKGGVFFLFFLLYFCRVLFPVLVLKREKMMIRIRKVVGGRQH